MIRGRVQDVIDLRVADYLRPQGSGHGLPQVLADLGLSGLWLRLLHLIHWAKQGAWDDGESLVRVHIQRDIERVLGLLVELRLLQGRGLGRRDRRQRLS